MQGRTEHLTQALLSPGSLTSPHTRLLPSLSRTAVKTGGVFGDPPQLHGAYWTRLYCIQYSKCIHKQAHFNAVGAIWLFALFPTHIIQCYEAYVALSYLTGYDTDRPISRSLPHDHR